MERAENKTEQMKARSADLDDSLNKHIGRCDRRQDILNLSFQR
jgi:hypothetical protein